MFCNWIFFGVNGIKNEPSTIAMQINGLGGFCNTCLKSTIIIEVGGIFCCKIY
jgi:hypothetical protein